VLIPKMINKLKNYKLQIAIVDFDKLNQRKELVVELVETNSHRKNSQNFGL